MSSGASLGRRPYSVMVVGGETAVTTAPVVPAPVSPVSPVSPVLAVSSPESSSRASPQMKENVSKPRPGMMYIMPDGRPLAAYLSSANAQETGAPGRMAPKGKKNQRKKGSATFGSRRSAPSPSLFASQLDAQDLKSLNKIGQRKQRRWTNDLLLRAMAPELSPSDIDGLFKPVPFGDAHPPSAFSMVEADSGMKELWQSCLLSVGMDKQERILEKWREYVDDLNRASSAEAWEDRDGCEDGARGGERRARNARRATMAAYRKRWEGSVSSSGRAAVKSVSEGVVRELEAQMLPCLFGASDQVEMHPKDGYGRLLGHSLAKFHGLSSKTRRDDQGGKYLVVRRCDGGFEIDEPMFIALSDWLLVCCQ